ncbi:aldo-keto reductase 1B-like [Saccoglossus kowalevskii]|uniref:Aldose reductase-like n=1 Tax=Saccoglossus kowalevskii TaxID=10224 RepID=A0ABM0GKX0_SACKO|nr:PREDICTED: aldose reductase-like [Saccoglossus kowalevskii]
MTAQTVKLWNGAEIPLVGLGTWGGWEAKPGEILKAVETAIDVGYRHIDTAYVYGVEHEVGDAINSKLKDGAVKREELFVVSKLWQKFMAPKDVKPMLLSTLKDLKLEYLDLYLIHKPVPYMNQGDIIPKNENGDVLFNHDVQHTDTWKEMEKLVDEGLVKSIGVSNFNHYQVQNILDHCRVKPAVIQVSIF